VEQVIEGIEVEPEVLSETNELTESQEAENQSIEVQEIKEEEKTEV